MPDSADGGAGRDGGTYPPDMDAASLGDAAPATPDAPIIVGDDRVIDFEDGSGVLLPHPIRKGAIYAVNDGTVGGVQQPAPLGEVKATRFCAAPPCPAAAPTSTFALHVTASGFTSWGSFIGTDLGYVAGMPARRAYDASGFTGMTFWARLGTAPGNAVDARVRFVLPDANTDRDGGQCTPNGGAMDGCYNDWGVDLTLTTAWRRFDIPFASLRQGEWGKRFTVFRADAIYGLQWKFPPSAVVDVWIDDVAFAR